MVTRIVSVALMVATMLVVGARHVEAQRFFEQTKGPQGGGFMSLARKGIDTLFTGLNIGDLYMSVDRGRSWSLRSMSFADRIQRMTIDAAGRLFAFVGFSNDSLFYSSDAGLTFSRVRGLDSAKELTSLAFGRNGTIVATGYGGAFLSNDLEGGFRPLTVGAGRPLFALNANDGTLFTLNVFGGGFKGKWLAYRSLDNGLSWKPYGDTLKVGEDSLLMSLLSWQTAIISPTGTIIVSVQDHGAFRLAAGSSPVWEHGEGLAPNTRSRALSAAGDGTLYLGTQRGVYRSTDDGRNWEVTDRTLFGGAVGSLLGLEDGSVLAIAGALYHSSDRGNSWSSMMLGIVHSSVSALAVSPKGTLFANSGRTILRSIDGGDSWTPAPVRAKEQGSIFTMIASDGGAIFAGAVGAIVGSATGGDVFRSTDDGISWDTLNRGLVANSVYVLAARAGKIFAATDSGVFRSTDNGDSWNATRQGLPGNMIRALTIAPDGDLFVGVTGPFANQEPTGSGIWRSTDNGETWHDANVGVDDPAFWWLASAPSGTLYAGALQGGAYRSSDNGGSWEKIDLGKPASTWIDGIGVDNTGIAYLSFDDGTIWRSSDEGRRWEMIDSLRFSFRIFAFEASGRVYAGSLNAGVWRQRIASTIRPASITTSDILLSIVERDHELELHYSLPRGGNLLLTLFDAVGNRIRTVADEWQNEGAHVIRLEVKGLASGTYVIHARFDGSSSSRTFTIVR